MSSNDSAFYNTSGFAVSALRGLTPPIHILELVCQDFTHRTWKQKAVHRIQRERM
jgi:hypothetical protein